MVVKQRLRFAGNWQRAVRYRREAEVSIRIDRAQHSDVPAVADIETRCFSDPWSEQSFGDILGHPGIYFLCAREIAADGTQAAVVGYVVAWFVGGEGEIANLAVAPEARERGVGGALLDRTLAEGARVGTSEVFLEVRSSNIRARRLYDSRGFVEVGRRRRYYRRPVEDAVILRWSESATVEERTGA